MFREPIGDYEVDIEKYETSDFGEEKYRRRVPVVCFIPKKNQLEKCPVLIYQHGLMGHTMESSMLCEDLASAGYAVISVGHPLGGGELAYLDGSKYEAPADFSIDRYHLSKLQPFWEEDIHQVLAMLPTISCAGKLDLEHGVHMIGVSLGGCSSVCMALREEKVKSAINLDGGLFMDITPNYPKTPILILCSPMNYFAHHKLSELKIPNVQIVKIRKVTHWEFSDGIYLSEKGQKNREWADRVSMERAKRCLEFLRSYV